MSDTEGVKRERKRKTSDYEKLYSRFYSRIKELYEAQKASGRGITSQKKLAERLDVHPTTISYWKNSSALPSMDMVYKIAEVFNVSIDSLFAEDSFSSSYYKVTINTYTDALRVLLKLDEAGLINQYPCEDYFLRYLLIECKRIKGRTNIAEERRAERLKMIYKDFDVPFIRGYDETLYQALADKYEAFDEYNTYLNVLNAAMDYAANKDDHDEIESYYMQWLDKNNPKKYQELYGGAGAMPDYSDDEDDIFDAGSQ